MFIRRITKFVSAGVFVASIATVLNAAPVRAETFTQGMLRGYNDMPNSLPDDRGLYPGLTGLSGDESHQYMTVAGGNIDDTGGNKSGREYRRASFVVYSNTNKSAKNLNFTFVDRAVNISGDTSTCDGQLDVGVLNQTTGAYQHDTVDNVKTNGGKCGKTVSTAFLINEEKFVEIKVKDNAGNEIPSGIYKAYVNVTYFSGKGSQASFRIAAPGARIGYQDWQSMNTYATKIANGHTLSFKWRPPCGTPSGNESGRIFSYYDGDEGNPGIQPTSAGATRDRIRAGAVLGSDTLRDSEQVIIPHNQLSSGIWNSEAVNLNRINGGNGISFNYPYESGNYFFDVCPPRPNSGSVIGVCDNYSPRDIRPRDSMISSGATRYKMFVFSGADGSGFINASAGNAGGTKNDFLGTNSGGAADDAQPWDWPDESIDGQQLYYKIDSYRADVKGNAVYVGSSSIEPWTFNCGTPPPPPPSWWVQHYRGDSGVVELGRTANYSFSFYNRWGNDAYPNSAMESNYDYYNPEVRGDPSANGGFAWAYNQADALNPIPANGEKGLQFVTTVPTDISALGKNYCQRFWINPAQVLNGNTTIGQTYSEHPSGNSNQCFLVVGGKTNIGGTVEAEAEPGDQVTFNISTTTNNYSGGGGWGGYTANCAYYTTTAAGPSAGSCTKSVTGNGTQNTPISYTVPSNVTLGSQICVHADLTIDNTAFMTDPRVADMCVRIVARPYFKVYGGDVSAGNGFNNNCIENSSVIGWNKGGPDYRGSGVQYAIYAQSVIAGVAAGNGLLNDVNFGGGNPLKLSFANTSGTASGRGPYGGGFGSGGCSNDYWSGKPVDNVNSWDDIADSNSSSYGYERVFEASGQVTIAGNFIARSNNTKLYVDGDVYIAGDITAQPGAESIDQIPNFMLIVKGNIYIGKDVKNLYGTYVAQPLDNGSKGEIFTCGTNSFGAFPNDVYYDSCKNQLIVTGAFVAKNVNLQRTAGTVNKDNGGTLPGGSGYTNAAEVFQYNPLTWLRQSTTTETKNIDTYDAMTILPPVL